jgi:hypothetical protein
VDRAHWVLAIVDDPGTSVDNKMVSTKQQTSKKADDTGETSNDEDTEEEVMDQDDGERT